MKRSTFPGLLVVFLLCLTNGFAQRYGFVNEAGIYVIQPNFIEAKNFSEGLAAVKYTSPKNTRYGYIDKTGKFVIEHKFWSANNFHEGFAAVEFSPGNFGLINKQGKFIIAKSFMDFMGVMTEGIISYRKRGKYGFYNSHGDEIAKNTYDDVREFKNGFARVKMDGKWGYINKEGKLIIPCVYDSSENFENNFAVVSKSSKFYKIGTNGVEEMSLPKQIDQGSLNFESFSILTPFSFSEGLACIREDKYREVFKK